MAINSFFLKTLLFLLVAFVTLFIFSCGPEPAIIESDDRSKALAGTWVLKSRIVAGKESPVTQRFMKLTLGADQTFTAHYRGDRTQNWVRAGVGAFSYNPPLLRFYWDSGQLITLLVREDKSDHLLLHHGSHLAPLKDQEPDEVFVRIRPEKGPRRGPS